MSEVDFTLINKALTGYRGNVKNLFTVGTWKALLKNSIPKTKDASKNENDKCLTKLAEDTIEQITGCKYSQKVSQILASGRAKRNQNVNNAQEFLKLCEEYSAKKSCKESDEEMETDEEEDDLSHIATSGLRARNSHEIFPMFNLINAIERPPARHKFNENIHLIPNHPVFQLSQNIDEDTPMEDAVSSSDDLELNPTPHKKTRYSCSADEAENGNPLPYRLRPQPIMQPIGEGDSLSVRRVRYNRPTRHARSKKNVVDDDDDDDDNDDKKRSASLPKSNPPEEPILENLPTTEEQVSQDYPHPPSCPDLNLAMFDAIREAMLQPEDKIASDFGLSITKNDLFAYNEDEWLEDANIDFYLEMIKDRNNREGSPYRKVYTFKSFFYKLLQRAGYDAVKDTTKGENIFDYDLVIIPIHAYNHWTLIVVDFEKKTINSYDSMGYSNTRELTLIHKYIYEEFKNQEANNPNGDGSVGAWTGLFPNVNPEAAKTPKLKEIYSEWTTTDYGDMTLPQQKNGSDCGVFCLQFAEYFSRGLGVADIDFRQEHMPYFRKRILFETITKTLLIQW